MNPLMVFIGGGLGALTRYCLYLVLPKNAFFPACTLTANCFGCLIATIVFSFFVYKAETPSIYKLLLITGFCGGLSTLSALSIEVLVYIQNSDYLRALLYILTSLLICTSSVILGLFLVKKYV